MHVRDLPPERTEELAALRRRAYGPAADIAGDPAAQARLAELEALLRDEPSRESDAEAPPAVVPEEIGAPANADVAGSVHAPASPPVARRGWSRRAAGTLAAAALVVGAAAGVGAVLLAQPQPDVVLREVASREPDDPGWNRDLQSWGISPDSATPYEEYDGVGVWVAAGDDSSRCLILEDAGEPVSASCVGAGLDPILDLTMYGGLDELFDDPPPPGSVIRFIGRDGAVEVWVRERQSIDSSWSVSVPSAR